MSRTPSFKIVLLGESPVGKTSLMYQCTENRFVPDTQPTIGASFVSRRLEVDDQTIDVMLWDTAGVEAYRSMTPLYYRDAQAVIVVFDVGSRSSFDLAQGWIENVRHNNDKALVALCGNMIDKEDRVVGRQDAEAIALKRDVPYFETSAKTGEGVNPMFESVIRSVFIRYTQENEEDFPTPAQVDRRRRWKKKSCA